ncbi:putative undecaprenyl-phosphate N-acetylgalactosaminyl 1-phosphate transferase [Rubripirellula tenax]|uniref:Putative undecaprenyl-phosphate N-acetylgalactosaminyl 1-phosphate transferase n=1 Tax=Rubripirellula tenax TaxID=2528015 RepID=A0A5C6FL45_9BACT|nr:sugar transferase [Rubripirellula tenax]TWU60727.1 putative undecaprenyl-phosphate N-acetylgalactosaminyl 1-phosphate transferase [Rubripirellula tenax]
MPSLTANSASAPCSPADASDVYVHPATKKPVSNRHSHTAIADEDSVSPSDERGNLKSDDDHVDDHVQPADYFRVKTLVDRFITVGLMLVAVPLMSIVAVAVLLLDGRPIFYRQVRVGKDGNLFKIWKFRTMRHNAEEFSGAVWSSADDPRVTALGRWLRRTHIDELPQFLNVLAGNMNLVGPRPERPEFVERLSQEVPGYHHRIQVHPGITGLAQLRLGYDESLAGVPKKLDYDLEYIRRTNFVGDLSLISKTLTYITRQLFCTFLATVVGPKVRTWKEPDCEDPVSTMTRVHGFEFSTPKSLRQRAESHAIAVHDVGVAVSDFHGVDVPIASTQP